MTTEELQRRIAAEQAELDQFLQQCNREASFRSGRLAMLRELLLESQTTVTEGEEAPVPPPSESMPGA